MEDKKRTKTPRTAEQQYFLDACHAYKFLPNVENETAVVSAMGQLRRAFVARLGLEMTAIEKE